MHARDISPSPAYLWERVGVRDLSPIYRAYFGTMIGNGCFEGMSLDSLFA